MLGVGSNQLLNITEENLHCHHLLFNRDVTTALYDSTKDCFKTRNLYFRRAKLNGIVVAQERLLSNYCIWLDDGTSVIKVILHKDLLKRLGSELVVIPNNVTVFGKVGLENNENVIHCGGFRVEEDNEAVELFHWLRVLQERPKTKISEKDKNMFYSLSSLPSPTRLLNDGLLGSPIRDAQNRGYEWSPDHSFAISTPIRAVQESQLVSSSPLKQKIVPIQNNNPDTDNDDDEFDDFGSIDLIALENNAILMNTDSGNKRKFDLTNME